MKQFYLFVFIFCVFLRLNSQVKHVYDSIKGLDVKQLHQFATDNNFTEEEESNYINLYERNHLNATKSLTEKKAEYAKLAAMPAANIDFELGNFSGWVLGEGVNLNSLEMLGGFGLPGTSSLCTGGTDPIVPTLSLTSPLGGNFIARVNYSLTNAVQNRIQNKIFVTADKNLLRFAYASVLQRANHSCNIQPYMAITLRDTLGNLLFNYYIEAPDSIVGPCKGYNQDNMVPSLGNTFYYTPSWRTRCVDLTPYTGNNIYLEVIGAACQATGHFGYGYFDAKLETCPDFDKPNLLTIWDQTVSLDPNLIRVGVMSCSNTAITMTAPAWPGYYHWNGPPNSKLFSTITATATSLNSGLHTLSMGSNSICPITKSIYIEAKGQPLNVQSNLSFCQGTFYTISASGADTYTWSNGQIGSTATVQAITPGSFTLGVFGTSFLTGCISQAISSYTVFANPTPTVSPNYSLVCAGAPLTFTGTGGIYPTWTMKNLTFQTTTVSGGSTFTCSPIYPTSFTFQITSPSVGCVGTTTWSYTPVQMPTVYSSINLSTVCLGSNVTFSAWGNGTTYTLNNGFNSYVLTNSIVLAPTSTAIYTISNANICGTASLSYPVNVTTVVPVLSITVPTLICTKNFVLTANGGVPTYSWTNSYGSYTTNTSGYNFGYPATVSGVYTLSARAFTGGCVGTQTVNINPLPSPIPVITPSAPCPGINTFTITGGGGVVFTITPANNIGNPIVPTFTSNNTFTLNTPANFYYYSIVGVAPNGCVYNNPFYIDPPGAALAPTINANTYTVCNGTSATLTANGAPNNVYLWSTGSIYNSIVVSPTTTTTYTVSTINGCGTFASTVEVQHLNVPTPTFIVTSNPVVPCAGSWFTISASGMNSYTWTPGLNTSTVLGFLNTVPYTTTVSGTAANGCIANSSITFTNLIAQTSPTITGNFTACPASPTTYSATGLSTYSWSTGSTNYSTSFTPPGTFTLNGTDANGCAIYPPKIINTYIATNPPTPSLNIQEFPCPGSVSKLAIVDPDGYYNTYTWNPGNINTPTVYVSPTITTIYTLYLGYFNGCTASLTPTTTINVLPSSLVSFTPSAYFMCENGPAITFSCTPSTSTPQCLSLFQGNFLSSKSGTYNVFAKHTTTNGCIFNSPLQTITVQPSPNVNITSTINTSCIFGNTINLSAIPNGGLFYGNGVSGSILTPSINGNCSVIYTYTDSNGCADYDHTCFNVLPLPTISVSASNTLVCTGLSSTLSAYGANNYTWSTGTVGPTDVITPSLTTTYTVIGESNGCLGSSTISASPGIAPTLTLNTSDTLICIGESVTLTVSGANSYTWNTGSNVNIIVISPSINTTYIVIGEKDGCNSSVLYTQKVIECVYINEILTDTLHVLVFPNPGNGIYTITQKDVKSKLPFEICNALGVKIYESILEGEKLEINISSSPNGIYFIKIGNVTKKLVKQ